MHNFSSVESEKKEKNSTASANYCHRMLKLISEKQQQNGEENCRAFALMRKSVKMQQQQKKFLHSILIGDSRCIVN